MASSQPPSSVPVSLHGAPFRDVENVNNKRKDAPAVETADDTKIAAAAQKKQATEHEIPPHSNAFSKRQQALNDYCNANSDYEILYLVPDEEKEHSILELAFGHELEQWKVQHKRKILEDKTKTFQELQHIDATRTVELMDDSKRQGLYSELTDKQIDHYYKVVLVRKNVVLLIKQKLLLQHFGRSTISVSNSDNEDMFGIMNRTEKGRQVLDLLKEDNPRKEKDILLKLLQGATQSIQKAIQALMPDIPLTNSHNKRFTFPTKEQCASATTTVPNVARHAFELALATLSICNELYEWRIDKEDCDPTPVIRSLNKVLRLLLWFHDDELGLVDPFSRNTLLLCLEKWSWEWSIEGEWPDETPFCMDFKTKKKALMPNNMGKGRSLVATAKQSRAPPTFKHPEITCPGKDPAQQEFTLNYLVALGEEGLVKRRLTHVQLEIEKVDMTDTSKSQDFCRIIVPGATDLRKLGQLMAYLIGKSESYSTDVNRGKRLEKSYFEFLPKDHHYCMIGDKAKNAKSAFQKLGTLFLFDRSIKITQIFQGLVTSETSGMVFDSPEAKRVTMSDNSFAWLYGKSSYVIRCQGVVPNSMVAEKWPLPRLLDGGDFCGRDIEQMNHELRDGRKGGPSFVVPRGYPQSWVDGMANGRMLQPICDANGVVL